MFVWLSNWEVQRDVLYTDNCMQLTLRKVLVRKQWQNIFETVQVCSSSTCLSETHCTNFKSIPMPQVFSEHKKGCLIRYFHQLASKGEDAIVRSKWFCSRRAEVSWHRASLLLEATQWCPLWLVPLGHGCMEYVLTLSSQMSDGRGNSWAKTEDQLQSPHSFSIGCSWSITLWSTTQIVMNTT